jgi:hypothetical protein
MTETGKLPISLVVIAANEERNLPRCLKAADFCSEIVVVDSGSTDHTLEIAAGHGAHIFHRPWSGFVAQKNFACEQASQPWVLCLDADEMISPELRHSIERSFQNEPPVDGFEMNRHSIYGDKLINHSGWYPQWRLFLFRRGSAVWGGTDPHAEVIFHGKQKTRLKGDLFHYTYTGIRHHVAKNMTFAREAAESMHAQGRRATWPDLLARAPWAMFRSYVIQRGFLSGFHGLVIAAVAGFYTFLKYAMLREIQMREKRATREKEER